MTTSDKEWYNEWCGTTISANFSIFQIREESTTKHHKENSLIIEEDLWRKPNELRAETSPEEEILTVRNRNARFSSK